MFVVAVKSLLGAALDSLSGELAQQTHRSNVPENLSDVLLLFE